MRVVNELTAIWTTDCKVSQAFGRKCWLVFRCRKDLDESEDEEFMSLRLSLEASPQQIRSWIDVCRNRSRRQDSKTVNECTRP